jgi:hypothetical protein
VIHTVIFFLLFAGLAVLSAYACDIYLHGNIALVGASIAIAWGIILLVMYVIFNMTGWTWWK